jgi:hypothetical protein
MSEPLLPDLPPALGALARSLYPNEILARRALLAPCPSLDFHSAWDERELWRSEGKGDRRQAFERVLKAGQEQFTSVEQPFFAAEGTLGTLRSPYPQLSDADYWLFVSLWGSEETARTWLEKPLFDLSGQTSVALLEKEHHKGDLCRLVDSLMGAGDRRLEVWYAHLQEISGNYR